MPGRAIKMARWRRGSWMVAAAATGVIGIAGWTTSGGPYASSCLLEVARGPVHGATGDRDRLIANLVALARDLRTPEAAIQAHPEILQFPEAAKQDNPVAWLGAGVSVEPIGGTDLIRVAGRADSPLLAAAITNAVADAIVEDAKRRWVERSDHEIKTWVEMRQAAEDEASKRRQAVRERGNTSEGGAASSVRTAVEADDLREIRKDLRRIRLEKKAVEVRLATNHARPEAASADLAVASAVLAAQETLLVESEKAVGEALARAELARLEFEAACDDLAHAEERTRTIKDQLHQIRSEVGAPWFVRKVSTAKPMLK